MRRRRNHLKRVLVRSEKSLIVAPPLNEGEATSFARRVCQCVDYVLLKKKNKNIMKSWERRQCSLRWID